MLWQMQGLSLFGSHHSTAVRTVDARAKKKKMKNYWDWSSKFVYCILCCIISWCKKNWHLTKAGKFYWVLFCIEMMKIHLFSNLHWSFHCICVCSTVHFWKHFFLFCVFPNLLFFPDVLILLRQMVCDNYFVHVSFTI